jgi:hypothetical protein
VGSSCLSVEGPRIVCHRHWGPQRARFSRHEVEGPLPGPKRPCQASEHRQECRCHTSVVIPGSNNAAFPQLFQSRSKVGGESARDVFENTVGHFKPTSAFRAQGIRSACHGPRAGSSASPATERLQEHRIRSRERSPWTPCQMRATLPYRTLRSSGRGRRKPPIAGLWAPLGSTYCSFLYSLPR